MSKASADKSVAKGKEVLPANSERKQSIASGRNRVAGVSLDEVEEELVKRKKMKKESWYDDEGKLVCVTVSAVLGTQNFVVDEDGGLRPNTP